MKDLRSKELASRRDFIGQCISSGAAAALSPVLGWLPDARANRAPGSRSVGRVLNFDRDWLFAGRLGDAAVQFAAVTLPHSVARLSWQNWEPSQWQDLWTYRRRFTIPGELAGLRVIVR